jgi:hypothetical protein
MSSDISDYVDTTSSTDRADINRILTLLQQIRPPVERDALKEFIAFATEVRKRVTSVITGGPSISDTDNINREAPQMMVRKKPTTVNSYVLTHVTTGTISFPVAGHKRSGNGVFSGSSYITVNDHSKLNITNEIGIAFWIKPQASSGDHLILSKDQQYQIKLIAGNKIQFRIYSGGAWKTGLEYTYTPNTWVNIVATYKSTSSGQKLYVNGSLNTSDSESGSINTTANNLKIGGDGTSNLPANTSISWLTFLNKEVDTTWITNFATNDILDTSGTNTEILTIPFIGNEEPKPNATSGLCRST